MNRRKYSPAQVEAMRKMFEERNMTPGQIARKFGATSHAVAAVLWRHGIIRGDTGRIGRLAREAKARALTKARLEWLYGHARAESIARGTDPATQADIASWNALGRRSAA